MSKSQETYSKKEKEKKRQKKKKEKDEKRMERKASSKGGGLDNMIAYIDENGNISDTPPDPDKKVEFELEDIVTSVPKQEEFDMETARQGKIDFFTQLLLCFEMVRRSLYCRGHHTRYLCI